MKIGEIWSRKANQQSKCVILGFDYDKYKTYIEDKLYNVDKDMVIFQRLDLNVNLAMDREIFLSLFMKEENHEPQIQI